MTILKIVFELRKLTKGEGGVFPINERGERREYVGMYVYQVPWYFLAPCKLFLSRFLKKYF